MKLCLILLAPTTACTGDMEPSFSLPAKLQVERKPIANVKSSASVEARISTAQHRVRGVNNPDVPTVGRKELSDAQDNASMTLWTFIVKWLSANSLPFEHGLPTRQQLLQNFRLRWSFAVCCAFSVLFLSFQLYAILGKASFATHAVITPLGMLQS